MLKNHYKYIASQGSLLALGSMLANLFGLLVPVVYNVLGTPAGYGVYQYVLVIMSLLGVTSLYGMNSAILVAAAQDKAHILRSASRRRIKYSLLLGCPVLLVAGLVFALWVPEREDVGVLCLVLLPAFPFMYAFMGVYSYLNGVRRFQQLAAAQIAQAFLSFVAVAICLWLKPESLLLAPAMALLVKTLFETCVYLALVRHDHIGLSDEDPKLLSYGMKVSITGVTANVESRLDRFIVGTVFGFNDLGFFGAGRAIVMPLRQLLLIYRQLYAPKLAKRRPGEALQLTHRAMGWSLLAIIPGFALLYWLLPWFYDTFLGKFENSATYARWFLAVVLCGVPFYFYYPFFQSQRQARREVVVRLARAGVLVLGLLILMYYFGLMGVIYAQIAAMVFMSAHSWFEARKSRGVE